MPAFTAVAVFLVEAAITYGVAMTAATAAFAINVVATGLAIMTSRLINGDRTSSAQSALSQGVRVTIPPATNNPIPVIYGTVWQQGTITDARISNQNKTMTYVLVLSEKTQTGTYSVGDIFWADTKLNFSGSTVISRLVPDDTGTLQTDDKWNGLIRIWVYAGGTDSSYQIFPTGGTPVNARTTLGESDTNYNLSNLVFAVVQLDYNADVGITALGAITFQITNSLKNPGSVWQDYMTSTRYGAGFSLSELNTASIASLNALSLSTTGLIQYNSDSSPSSQARYEINGIIPTSDTIKNNMERINRASASWTTYDYGEGTWKLISNTTGTSTFSFNDDNIISEITLSVTPLEDQYNKLEVEFPDRGLRDQFNYFREDLNPIEMNDLEPTNELRLRLDMVNNAIHAARLGRIEMRQSRVDYVLSFTADYSAIQCQVGDVVSVTNSVYGFDNDLFRVTRVREVETESGGLVAEIVLLQYSADVYSETSITDFANKPISNIPIFGSTVGMPTPAAPVVSVSNPNSPVPTFSIQTTIPSPCLPVTSVEIFYNSSSTGVFSLISQNVPTNTVFDPGEVVTSTITTLPSGNWWFKSRIGSRNQFSNLSAASNQFNWSPSSEGSTFVYTSVGTSTVTVSQVKFTPDNFNKNTQIINLSFTSPVTGIASVSYNGYGLYTENDLATTGYGYYSVQNDNATFDGWNRLEFSCPNSSTVTTPLVTLRTFPVTANSATSFSVYASKFQAGDTFTIDGSELTARVTAAQ